MNKNERERRIAEWMREALDRLDARHPVAAHLDDLLGPQEYQTEPVGIALAAFDLAVRALGKRSDCSLILCWPCGVAAEIDQAIPNELLVESDGEPPSLILVHAEAGMLHEPVEEYRKSIDPRDYAISNRDVVAYYRCFRDKNAIDNDWEFSRALYFEYLLPDRRL